MSVVAFAGAPNPATRLPADGGPVFFK